MATPLSSKWVWERIVAGSWLPRPLTVRHFFFVIYFHYFFLSLTIQNYYEGCKSLLSGCTAMVSGSWRMSGLTDLWFMPIWKSWTRCLGEDHAVPRAWPFYFVQDNGPIHTTSVVKTWFWQHHVITLPHPPKSPDLGLIENVWAAMGRELPQDHICSHHIIVAKAITA